MHRYLLFDSGCSQCTEIARAVEQAAQSGLEARSLRDPAMQRLLAQARPHWRWQPTLLEVEGERVRAFTGLAMGMRLAMKLGPHRTLHLLKLIGRFNSSLKGMEAADRGRRRFLEQLAAIVLVLGLPNFRRGGKDGSGAQPQALERRMLANQVLSEGEIYEGFLLLPDGASLPSFVQCAPAPVLCETGSRYDPAFTGKIIGFTSIEGVRNYVPFPLYVPAVLPPNVQLIGMNVIQFAGLGDIFAVTINFGITDINQSRITVRARPIYPRPYPIWPVHSPVCHEKELVYPDKVSFLPAPGIMRPSATGYVLDWIQHDVLYTLVVEHSLDHEAIVTLAKSLVGI